MIDTTRLTAAVETLQEYCEQVRHVMVARGYADGYLRVDAGTHDGGHRRATVWVHYGGDVAVHGGGRTCESFRGPDAFAAALAHAESLPPRLTPADFARSIGIAPDGRVLEPA